MSIPDPDVADEAGDPSFSTTFLPPALEHAVLALRLLALLATLGAVVSAVAVLMPSIGADGNPWPPGLLLLTLAVGACATGLFAVAAALRQRRRGARAAGIVCGCLVLGAFPVGTAIGGYLLWLLLLRWPPKEPAADERDDGA